MKKSTVETLIWVLVYGGLLLLCLGVFVMRGGTGWGWSLVVAGGLIAAVGAALVGWRARMNGPGD